MNVRNNKLVSLAALGLAGGLALTACGGGDNGGGDTGNGGGSDNGGAGAAAGAYGELTGSIKGSGASSMQAAQTAWTETFNGMVSGEGGSASVSYNAIGSGDGRAEFLNGDTQFAGTDAPLDEEELAQSADVCNGGQAFNLPVYISPIAVAYNLPGVEELNLTPANIAKIFDGKITKWNDEAIAKDNPDADLPDTQIIPVHRSDDSGTTENFTEYLEKAAGDDWSYGTFETWDADGPSVDGQQSGDGTSGVKGVIEGTEGTIGYLDASQAIELGIAKVEVGGEFLEYSPEAAAKVVEVSPRAEGREDNDIVVELARDTEEAGAYPIVLISYVAMCDSYADAEQGEAVKAYVSYMLSEQGQQTAAENAGSAPISDALREDAQSAVDAVSAG